MRKIELYTFIYNDEDFLPFFLEYYKFVDRMTFIDSGSTDRSINIIHRFATSNNPEIRITQTGLIFWDHAYGAEVRNNIWKGSKYDLVLFPDLDEIFYYPNINKFLRTTKFDIYEMEGFEMVSNKMPRVGEDILSIRTGVKFNVYNKSTIFNPRVDICFPNAHLRCSMCTNVSVGDVKLLHYRTLGLAMMRKRNDREKSRLPANCKYRVPLSERQIIERYNSLTSNAKIVI